MDTRFDQISKVLSSDVSRRTAFKFVGVSVLGAMLSTIGVKQAEAIGQSACRDAGDPPCTENGCHGTATGQGCGCVPKVRDGVEVGRGICHQGQSCAGLTPCTRSSQCREALGKNWKCTNSCCTGGSFCLPKCGTVAGAPAGAGKTSLG
jgi:hypothetical protein